MGRYMLGCMGVDKVTYHSSLAGDNGVSPLITAIPLEEAKNKLTPAEQDFIEMEFLEPE